MPLGLMPIGSCRNRDNYEVNIVDARGEKNAHRKVLDHIEGALCFGVSVLTCPGIRDALEITRKVKQAAPTVITVWGGWHCSLFPLDPLKEEPSVGITVQGQGEVTFVELAEALATQTELKNIEGIARRNRDRQVIRNNPRPMADINELPPVDYSLIDVGHYFKMKGKKQLDYISSVGCFYRCAFCADPFVFNRKFSAISPERMAEEIETLYHKRNEKCCNPSNGWHAKGWEPAVIFSRSRSG